MKRTLRTIRLLVLCGCPLVNPSLTHADVVRHKIVADIVAAYEKAGDDHG